MKAKQKELLTELYDVAKKIKQLAPWDYLYEQDLITIKLPDRDDYAFCSIMGSGNECYGIAVYTGEDGLFSYKMMQERPNLPFPILVGYQDCIVCNYGNRNELMDEEVSILKEISLRFRGNNNWIYFRSHKPGLMQWTLNFDEYRYLLDILKNLYMSIKSLHNGTEVDFENGYSLFREYSEVHKLWLNYPIPMPELKKLEGYFKITNDLVLKKLNKLEKNENKLECELFYPLMPIQDNDNQRPYYQRILLIADKESGMVINFTPVDDDDLVNDILSCLVDLFMEEGRPNLIHVRDEFLYSIIFDLCKKIKVKIKKDIDMLAIDEIIESMDTFIDLFEE